MSELMADKPRINPALVAALEHYDLDAALDDALSAVGVDASTTEMAASYAKAQ